MKIPSATTLSIYHKDVFFLTLTGHVVLPTSCNYWGRSLETADQVKDNMQLLQRHHQGPVKFSDPG